MERVFEDTEEPRRTSAETRPYATLKDEGSSLLLTADLPGVSEKEIQLTVHQEVLTLRSERTSNVPEGYSVHRQERPALKLARSFALPCKVDVEKTSATMKNGVLTVRLAKVAEAQPRQITVKAG